MNVLNTEATGQYKGMARPGYFFIDTKGVIREKFFEAKYRQRFSGNNMIGKLFPALGDEVTDKVDAPHLTIAVAAIGPDRLSWRPDHVDGRSPTPARCARLCTRESGLQVHRPDDGSHAGDGVHPGEISARENSLSPGDQGTRSRFRGTIPHHARAENKLCRRLQQFPGDGRKDIHDQRKARLPGVRQQDLLPADVGAGTMATASSAARPPAGSGRYSAQVKRRPLF